MNYKDYLVIVKEKVKESRYEHTLKVIEEAVILANIYKENIGKTEIAAALHDISKYEDENEMRRIIKDNYDEMISNYPTNVLHGFVSRIRAMELGITDDDILNAIKNHTTARPNMSQLEKIIYIADFSNSGRTFKEAKIAHNIALVSLDAAMLYILVEIEKYLNKDGFKALDISKEALKFYDKEKNRMDIELIKIKEALDNAKMMEIHLYDLCETNPFFNYVFVCTAQNKRHLDSVVKYIDEENITYDHIEGEKTEWLLIDKGDILIHVLTKEKRELYNLDNLYIDYNKLY